MKHTPGPWIVDEANPELVATLKNKVYQYVCDCDTDLHDGCITQEQENANARLIAAAPDLLEACKELVDSWYDDDSNFYVEEPKSLKLARKAIQKAEG